ncbi:hypothetical protein SPRG_13632 [Saprolegnia parasitica CBS 223.65]|uniref:Dickkopf N-terminal cysteine-rich domain-containing protein n=1 Tax=Saprolegnia parasitica (strain CBS 223.65) TaxID=695850 RepID=A0A067C1Z3_SAPPC|nr:hypothetical protein SPRG_13632 [Saprolegnia parasitica CBS 223.65]KDO20817.1 hypothetical protein SPRG_13632 [Saprolegnia parasitica CBS 223.65]|eukprot:XP_012208475.1 hypothetical protein SPRG_13632 [Saprolegnia parasitica CBS 223.65]
MIRTTTIGLLLMAVTALRPTAIDGSLGLPCIDGKCNDGSLCYHESAPSRGLCSTYVERGSACDAPGILCAWPAICTEKICAVPSDLSGFEGSRCHRGACYDGSMCVPLSADNDSVATRCRRL